MNNRYTLVLVFLFGCLIAQSQTFELTGQFRPRAEFKHGYRSLLGEDVEPGFAISQRTRLNVNYSSKLFKTGLSIQDVRIWGDVSTGNKADLNGLMLHQAWGELLLTNKFSFKAGRQTLIYDDQRLFGNSEWNQQGRSHDALLVKYEWSPKSMIHAGFAYNQNVEKDTGNYYGNVLNYKAMQYLWAHHEINGLGISLVFVNNGFPFRIEEDSVVKQVVKYSQTAGPYLSYQKKKIKASLAAYYQFGLNVKNVEKSAFYLGGDVNYTLDKFTLGLAFQYLSGNDQLNPDEKDHEFFTLFGTGHKFNGWMDYFYAGSGHKAVGLLDINLPVKYTQGKWTGELRIHAFQSAADVKDIDAPTEAMNPYLGTEVDLGVMYTFSPDLMILGGYSRMFATETMQAIKGGDYKTGQHWAWLMLNFSPTFFKSEK
jgi:hypothetical protein